MNPKLNVVVEVAGGAVAAVYADLPIECILIDWDNIKEGGHPEPMPPNPLSDMEGDTLKQYRDALDPYRHLTQKQRAEIRDAALEQMIEDTQQDWKFPRNIFEIYLDRVGVDGQLDAITQDDEELRLVLDFDPETGKRWKKPREET